MKKLLFVAIFAIAFVSMRGQGYTTLGVGINQPVLRLCAEGLLMAKEVKVTLTGWPDYVFGADYRLRSLSETEAYIREQGHLPDVPSATEVEEEGLSLGEMNKVLLQKVEELTLHVIELQKQIDELKNQQR